MYIMRDKRTHKPLALGFSVDGLKFTTDERGRYIFFKNARAVVRNGKVEFKGDLRTNENIYVELYSKKKHEDNKAFNRLERLFEAKVKQYAKT